MKADILDQADLVMEIRQEECESSLTVFFGGKQQ